MLTEMINNVHVACLNFASVPRLLVVVIFYRTAVKVTTYTFTQVHGQQMFNKPVTAACIQL